MPMSETERASNGVDSDRAGMLLPDRLTGPTKHRDKAPSNSAPIDDQFRQLVENPIDRLNGSRDLFGGDDLLKVDLDDPAQ